VSERLAAGVLPKTSTPLVFLVEPMQDGERGPARFAIAAASHKCSSPACGPGACVFSRRACEPPANAHPQKSRTAHAQMKTNFSTPK